jgi:GTP-binding protein YchF
MRDKEIIDTELQLKDLEAVEARLAKVQKQAKAGDKEAAKIMDACEQYKAHLEKGLNARTIESLTEEQLELTADLNLLTAKPVLYVCNVDEAGLKADNQWVKDIRVMAASEGAEVLVISAAAEADIAELEDPEERAVFLEDLGLQESGVAKLIKAAYRILNYITYFTVGEKEVRAWTITDGMKAPQAAAVIHSDFEKGFIRAEVIKYNDYVQYKTEVAIKEAGKLGVEGKEYVVKDGDCMHFRFNV